MKHIILQAIRGSSSILIIPVEPKNELEIRTAPVANLGNTDLSGLPATTCSQEKAAPRCCLIRMAIEQA